MPSLDFLESGAVVAARQLIGWRFYVKDSSGLVGGTIVETEAYSQDDAASHSYRGQTPRNQIMFGPAGHVYVYFTYGMHFCMNIVTGPEGRGEAVLLRALAPDSGLDVIRSRRHSRPDGELTNGPAKLCQALAIDAKDNGAEIGNSRFMLLPPTSALRVHSTERIGISRDTHRLWRFVGERS